ncbi:MAG TPA: hypothetical protein VIM41_16000 [Gammaproteobacteria bacterium]
MRIPVISLLFLFSVVCHGVFAERGFADTLVIPDISNQPGNLPEAVPRPARGTTMDQVKEEFGSPLEVRGPVGNPPITRWVYDRFVVHFEHQYVIHSVVRKNQ